MEKIRKSRDKSLKCVCSTCDYNNTMEQPEKCDCSCYCFNCTNIKDRCIYHSKRINFDDMIESEEI